MLGIRNDLVGTLLAVLSGFASLCIIVLAPGSLAHAQPSARAYVQMAYDSESGRIVLFGGQTGSPQEVSAETWTYDPATREWEQHQSETSPPALGEPNLAYDADSDLVVLWGGVGPGVTHATELWTYDTNASVWTFHEQDPTTSPFGRVGSRMAYDEESDVIVLYGGCSAGTGRCFGDTWTLDTDSGTWTQLQVEEAPEGRNFHQLTYHPDLDRVFLWGGDVDGIIDRHMWSLDVDGAEWTEHDIVEEAPHPRYYGGVAALGRGRGFLVFGGGNSGNDQTWIYDPGEHAWAQVDASGPGKRSRFAMASAGKHGIFLFGGQLERSEFDYENDLWHFDPRTLEWTPR